MEYHSSLIFTGIVRSLDREDGGDVLIAEPDIHSRQGTEEKVVVSLRSIDTTDSHEHHTWIQTLVGRRIRITIEVV